MHNQYSLWFCHHIFVQCSTVWYSWLFYKAVSAFSLLYCKCLLESLMWVLSGFSIAWRQAAAMLAFVRHRTSWTFARCCVRFLLPLPQKLLSSRIHTSLSISGRAVPELTSIRYPNITRGDFGSLTSADIEFFKTFLSNPGQVLTEDDDLMSYNIDWMRNYRGVAGIC